MRSDNERLRNDGGGGDGGVGSGGLSSFLYCAGPIHGTFMASTTARR